MTKGLHDPRQSTSLSLLERARRQEPQAWDRLVALYRPLVVFWCHRGGVRGLDAEDVSQEVFAAAAGGLDRFHRDRPGDTFRGWLHGITRNHIRLFYRHNQHHARADGSAAAWDELHRVPDPCSIADDEEQAEVGRVYCRAMELIRGDFEEHTWQAFCRTVLDGRSPLTLTEELGMTAAAIRQAKARVLRRLKEVVGDVLS
jgi:RNA polymerase sigma-70 factor (ECF subfamily)